MQLFCYRNRKVPSARALVFSNRATKELSNYSCQCAPSLRSLSLLCGRFRLSVVLSVYGIGALSGMLTQTSDTVQIRICDVTLTSSSKPDANIQRPFNSDAGVVRCNYRLYFLLFMCG